MIQFQLNYVDDKTAISKFCGLAINKDDLIDIDEFETQFKYINKNTLLVAKHNKFDIIGNVCRCNLTDEYMQNNTKYPLYYLTIRFVNQIVAGYLYNIFIYFTPDEKTGNNFKNLRMTGKYTVEIEGIEKTPSEFFEFAEKELFMDECQKYPTFMEKTPLEKLDIVNEMKMKIQNEINSHENLFQPQKLPKNHKTNKMIQYLLNQLNHPFTPHLIKFNLLIREEERHKKNPDSGYGAIPTNIVKISEIAKDTKKAFEIPVNYV